MNDVIEFGGRGKPMLFPWRAAYEPFDGMVYSLVLTVHGIEFIGCYCRMIVIDEWGIRLVNPFRRISNCSGSHDHAHYLSKDVFVFRAAKIVEIPQREWMLREL